MHVLPKEAKTGLGISLTQEQISAFDTYQHELADWNQRSNLTAIREPQEVERKLFLESLSCLLAMQGSPMGRVVDVGTGAGFPGLPLKIIHPEMGLTLVESNRKKAAFLEHMVQVLSLDDVEVLHIRAEKAGHLPTHRETYDWALARAVAALPVLCEYLLPFVKVGGFMLAQKGARIKGEVDAASEAMAILGGGLIEVIPVTLPGVLEERSLVLVEKMDHTPEKYPRREGIPAKRPLGR
ncbi:MAG: 16S rRNA (guanine(527)-N(7))-methyltransferase RsmG [Chloroflexi bacterium]|nr:16S rRNA (guanine(527)-N(7))-methyltransferase RsmG [Chloroflexota bacterium]